MSGSFESVRWNACVHRLHLGFYTHPKEILGNGVKIKTHVNSEGEKSPRPEDQRRSACDTASRRTASPPPPTTPIHESKP